MEIILDNNILFSLMKPDSTAAKLFEVLAFDYVAPDFILKEFRKHELECMKKSGLNKNDFEYRKNVVLGALRFVSYEEYREFIKQASKLSPDEDDAPYFALALKLNLPVWSNDSALKNQDKINVLETKDLVSLI